MRTLLIVILLNVLLSLALGGLYAWWQLRRRREQLAMIHDMLDFLDPSARPLSLHEEETREKLMKELERLQ